ncbi:hypothetical protein D1647_22780 [Alistipes sp. Z76]|nr:hypothetical protein [Alistipes sp. Z76]NCE70951.1 hypothetical protein [Muribaculaceae bacterium M3]
MKRYHILFAALLSVAAARSEERPDSLQAAPTVEVAEAVGKVGATVVADDEFRRSRQRFLPMRRRIDREIGKVKYAYKGEVMLGLTASYGTITSEDTDFWIIVDNIDAEGTTATVKPFFGYFYRDNNCVGVRFGYNYVHGKLGNVDLDLGDKNDISFSVSDMNLSTESFSVGVFHRSYAGLDPKGRFGLFAELELAYSTGKTRFNYMSGEETKYTRSDNRKLKLSFNPGVAVYIFPNVCGTLSFGLGGVQYASVKQFDGAGAEVGKRTASKMRFRLNLADINIGMIVHLWDKKKE